MKSGAISLKPQLSLKPSLVIFSVSIIRVIFPLLALAAVVSRIKLAFAVVATFNGMEYGEWQPFPIMEAIGQCCTMTQRWWTMLVWDVL